MSPERASSCQDEEAIEQYSQFYIGLDEIICLPRTQTLLGSPDDDASSADTISGAVRPLAAPDGLSSFISQITQVRNAIRSNMEQSLQPVVDYTILYQAVKIDAIIREWRLPLLQSDLGDLIELLYKQMMWIYLWQTIYPLQSTSWVPKPKITSAVKDGLALLESFPSKNSVQALLLTPTFIIGCCAFDPAQRSSVRSFICTIKENTGFKDADLVSEVLEKLWGYIDQKDERSWDWQSIAQEMRKNLELHDT